MTRDDLSSSISTFFPDLGALQILIPMFMEIEECLPDLYSPMPAMIPFSFGNMAEIGKL